MNPEVSYRSLTLATRNTPVYGWWLSELIVNLLVSSPRHEGQGCAFGGTRWIPVQGLPPPSPHDEEELGLSAQKVTSEEGSPDDPCPSQSWTSRAPGEVGRTTRRPRSSPGVYAGHPRRYTQERPHTPEDWESRAENASRSHAKTVSCSHVLMLPCSHDHMLARSPAVTFF